MPKLRPLFMSFPSLFILTAVLGSGCGSLEDIADDLLSHHSGDPGGPSPCSYQGKDYPIGASFPSADGCNVCSCDMNGVACSTKGCGGTGGSTVEPPPSCEELMVPSAPVGCSSYDSLKQASTQVCSDRMMVLNDLKLIGTCADGASAQTALAVCCAPQPPPAGSVVSCTQSKDSTGALCTICTDASGMIVKTDCPR